MTIGHNSKENIVYQYPPGKILVPSLNRLLECNSVASKSLECFALLCFVAAALYNKQKQLNKLDDLLLYFYTDTTTNTLLLSYDRTKNTKSNFKVLGKLFSNNGSVKKVHLGV